MRRRFPCLVRCIKLWLTGEALLTQLCTFGVVVDVGSRDETPGVNDGASHVLEVMAFKSTRNRSD
jgi:predicted Zn-dependent peptidase